MEEYLELERSIEDTGKEIYSSTEDEVPSVFDGKRWNGRTLQWAMKNEAFKIKLLRFVDVRPPSQDGISV